VLKGRSIEPAICIQRQVNNNIKKNRDIHASDVDVRAGTECQRDNSKRYKKTALSLCVSSISSSSMMKERISSYSVVHVNSILK